MFHDPYSSLFPNPAPLYIREFNETTHEGAHFLTYQPKEPGVYALILEVSDSANNSAYVRRFVIYDPISTVTLDKFNISRCVQHVIIHRKLNGKPLTLGRYLYRGKDTF